ncbi:MAG TPA: hypothetical protein VFY20_04880, partial [Gemmatimonadales bacterium]|nr:hypothetical protein [Gemmatimonadales bacterium]
LPGNLKSADLDAALKGMNAELAAAPGAAKEAEARQKAQANEEKAYEKAKADYDKQQKTWDACVERVRNDPAAAKKSKELADKSEAASKNASNVDDDALEAKARQVQAAAERIAAGKGTAADQKLMAEFQADMAKMQQGSNAALSAMNEQQALSDEQAAKIKACGAEPQRPKQPDGLGWSPERVLMEKGAQAAGKPEQQYALLREFAVMSGGMRVTSKKYSEDEAARINAQLDQIRDVTGQMRAAKIPL